MKVEIDYMYLYYPSNLVIDVGSEVVLNLGLQIKFVSGSQILPFDITNAITLIGVELIPNPTHIDQPTFYQANLKVKNISTEKVVIKMGMAVGYIKMNFPFKVYDYTNKADE
jgi:hypothetical protein